MIRFEANTNFDMARDWGSAQSAMFRELKALGAEMREKAKALLRDRGRRSSGDLIDSLDEDVWQTASGFTVEVGPHVSYGLFVETGTRPHWAPIAPLKGWARTKFGLVGKEKNALAYAVQRKIAREGTEPTPYMADTYRFFLPLIANRLAQAVDRGLR